ncbi:MAG: hypothetical protein MPJ50_14310 [Pirellulales bacterium]|nr:hypothetical protein [Pirellulales bacterium]
MNFVGKILVFLIFLASTVFMTGTFMVFATQKNWREAVVDPQNGLKTQVANQAATISDLNRQVTDLNERAALQRAELRQWLAASQSRAADNQKNYDEQRELAQTLQNDQRNNVAEIKELNERLAVNDEELKQVRDAWNKAQKERDAAEAVVATLEDSVAQTTRQVELLQERNAQLATDLNLHRKALADNDLQLDGEIKVEGVITKIDEQNFVQLSIGSDDGLQPGKVLDVYRYSDSASEPKWLGKVEVRKLESDQAVAHVIPEFRQGRLQVGDRVATLALP